MKTTLKRLLTMLLCLTMLVTVLPAGMVFAADVPGADGETVKMIFDDKANTATISSWGVESETVIDKTFKKEGDASMKISYKANSGQSTSALFFGPHLKIDESLKKEGVLQFWYYCEDTIPQITLAFTYKLSDNDQSESRVALRSNYITDRDCGKWKLVQIPLSEFPEMGRRWDKSINNFVDAEFNWSDIQMLAFYGATKDMETVAPVYIDSLCIKKGVTIVKPEETEPEGVSYYVSPNGSDANSGLSPDKPLKTPQRAADKTLPGDTVYFMGGEYNNNGKGYIMFIKRSGTEDGYITYKNYNDEVPVFKAGGNVWDCILIAASYLVIDGLKLVGINDEITLEEGMDSYNQYIKHQDQPEFMYDEAAVARTNTNGISINGRNVAAGQPKPTHITVKNCDVSMFPGGGISCIEGDYITIENNHVYDNMWWSLWGGSGISFLYQRDIDENNIPEDYKCIIRNNIVHGNKCYVTCQNGRKMSDGNGIIIDYNKNAGQAWLPYKGKTLIENNLVYENGGGGIHVFYSSNVDVINNTTFNNGRTPELYDWGNLSVNWATNVKFINNIAVSTEVGSTPISYGIKNNQILLANNIQYNTANPENDPAKNSDQQLQNDPKISVNNTWADPGFVDAANGDFRLKADSAAVDIGTKTMAPAVDLTGAQRPQGANIDMGCYESSYTSANPATNNEIDFSVIAELSKEPVEEGECAKGTPKIDGEIDDIWENTQKLLVKKYNKGNGAYGTVRTMWDANFLYVLAEINDTNLTETNERDYNNDSIEFFIDEDNAKTVDYLPDDAQYRVSFSNKQSFGMNPDKDNFKTATAVTGSGYIVEAAIPFKTIKPENFMKIGFDVQINDGSPTEEATISISKWSDKESTTWQDTSRFGDLLLVDSYLHLESDDATQIKVLLDNVLLQFPDVLPFILEGRTLVPFRAIFEAMGATVGWDEATETVTGTLGDKSVVLQINNKLATANGQQIELDVPAMLHEDRTMVPIRFIAESLGAQVDWIQSRSMVVIKTK